MLENSYYHFLLDRKFFGQYAYKERDDVIYLYKKDNGFLKEASQLKFMHDDLAAVVASEAHITVHQYYPQNTTSAAIKNSPFHFSIYFNKGESTEAILRIYFNAAAEISEFTLTFDGRYYVGDLWLKEISELAAGIARKTIRRLADKKNTYCQELRTSLDNLDQEITKRSMHCNLHDESFDESLECFYEKVSQINRYSDDKFDHRGEALRQCFLSDLREEVKDQAHGEVSMANKAIHQRRPAFKVSAKTAVAAADKQLLELSEVAEKLNALINQNILLKELKNISLNLSENESLTQKAENIWRVIADSSAELTDDELYNIASQLYQYRVLALLYYKKPHKKQKSIGRSKKQASKPESPEQRVQKEINEAKILVESIPDVKETFKKYLALRKPTGVRHLYPMLMGADISEDLQSFVILMRDDKNHLSADTRQIADYFYQHSSAYRWIIIDHLRPINYINSANATINMVQYFDSIVVSFLFDKFTIGDFRAFELFIKHGVFPHGIHGVVMHQGKVHCLTLMQMILGVFFNEHSSPPVPFINAIIASGNNIQEIRDNDFFSMSVSLKTFCLQEGVGESNGIVEFKSGLVDAAQYTNHLEFFFSRYSHQLADEGSIYNEVYQLLQQNFLDRIAADDMGFQPNSSEKMPLTSFRNNTLCYAPFYVDKFAFCNEGHDEIEECSKSAESNAKQLQDIFLQYSLEDQESLISFFHSNAQQYYNHHEYYSALSLTNLMMIFLMNSQLDSKIALLFDMSILRIDCLLGAGNIWLCKVMLEQAIMLTKFNQLGDEQYQKLVSRINQLSLGDGNEMVSAYCTSRVSGTCENAVLTGNPAAMFDQVASDACNMADESNMKASR